MRKLALLLILPALALAGFTPQTKFTLVALDTSRSTTIATSTPQGGGEFHITVKGPASGVFMTFGVAGSKASRHDTTSAGFASKWFPTGTTYWPIGKPQGGNVTIAVISADTLVADTVLGEYGSP